MFSYYLNTGDCIGSYPEFEVSLFKDSFFTVTSYNPTPPLTLTSYPTVFMGKGALLLSKLSPEFYHPAARLIEIQGYLQQSAPDISLTDLATLNNGTFDYAVLVLDAKEVESLSPPVDITPTLQINHPLSKAVLLQLDTAESATIQQTFYSSKQLPMLLYGQRNTPRFPSDSLSELLSSHSRANVGIIHDEQWYALEIGEKFRVIYPGRRNFAFYWARYRILFFILIRAEIAEIRMAALPIVKPFNIFKNSRLGFLTGNVSFSVNQLYL